MPALKSSKHEYFAHQVAIRSGASYVYALTDSFSGDVFYIGKGRGRRMFQHELDAKRGKPGVKNNRIREVLASGAMVECRVLAVFESDVEAYAAEKRLIAEHKNLTNMNAGGGGGMSVGESAKSLLKRLKPYTQWLCGLSAEKYVLVEQVFGGPRDCYEYMSGNLRDNAGVV